MTTSFTALTTTQLGDIGERYIPEFARAKKIWPYTPAFNASFPVDSMHISKDYKVCCIEVKTKPRLRYKKMRTGYDIADHKI